MIPQRVNIAVLRLELRELILKFVFVSTAHAVLLVPLEVNGSNFYMQVLQPFLQRKKLRKKN